MIGVVSSLEVTCDVPQWSVLGPTLWNTYNNDILDILLLLGVDFIGYAVILLVSGR